MCIATNQTVFITFFLPFLGLLDAFLACLLVSCPRTQPEKMVLLQAWLNEAFDTLSERLETVELLHYKVWFILVIHLLHCYHSF